MNPICFPNFKYGSPDSYMASRFLSPLKIAAMAYSWFDQSRYARPYPGGGLMSPRTHLAGEKMKPPFGAFREVFAQNGMSDTRFRPSLPIASFAVDSIMFSVDRRVWRSSSSV